MTLYNICVVGVQEYTIILLSWRTWLEIGRLSRAEANPSTARLYCPDPSPPVVRPGVQRMSGKRIIWLYTLYRTPVQECPFVASLQRRVRWFIIGAKRIYNIISLYKNREIYISNVSIPVGISGKRERHSCATEFRHKSRGGGTTWRTREAKLVLFMCV